MFYEESKMEFKKINRYFRVLDCIIMGLRIRYSTENLTIGVSVDHFMKLKYEVKQQHIT